MPRDLFGDVTRPSISIGNRKWYTVPVSLLSHSIIIAMVVVAADSGGAVDARCARARDLDYVITILPPPPPPPALAPHGVKPRRIRIWRQPWRRTRSRRKHRGNSSS